MWYQCVALRKESVDRNQSRGSVSMPRYRSLSARRAWIEIAWAHHRDGPQKWWSLSARRAWIEIAAGSGQKNAEAVALRKESVDRNLSRCTRMAPFQGSLSARRAWIEMMYVIRLPRCQVVALRKESVDRNQTL